LFESLLSALGVAVLAVLPFALLGAVARLFGVDSPEMNPDERGHRIA
jgi:hypothetical protein